MDALTCPMCHQLCRERCDDCGRYAVVPDPWAPAIPRHDVGSRAARLWDVTQDVARGRVPASGLSWAIANIETPLRRAATCAGLRQLAPWLEAALLALEHMREFVDTRNVCYLTEAWLTLAPAMAGLRETAEAVGIGMQIAGTATVRYHGVLDSIDEFTDPDE